jgi:hypothetical protein
MSAVTSYFFSLNPVIGTPEKWGMPRGSGVTRDVNKRVGKKWRWKQEMVRLRQQRIFRLLSLSEFNFRRDRLSGAKT